MAHRLDELLAVAGLDVGAGLQVVDAARLAAVPFDPGLPLVILPADGSSAAPTLPGRQAAPGAVAILRRLYPPAHALRSLPAGEPLALEALGDERLVATAWLVPALGLVENLASPHALPAISARLRAPDGCPWDRRQTHASLVRYLIEEAYETVDAIEHGTPADLAEELGDVLLQVVLHTQFAAEAGAFDLADVYRGIGAKIVRRHPHVFGELEVSGVEQVVRNWEAIKASERAAVPSGRGAFAGVARALPALPASREIQERAAALGWDWEQVEGVWDKVAEELNELRAAETQEERRHELGDLLFVIVNLARWLDLDPEEALRHANRRTIGRLEAVEALAASRGIELSDLPLDEKNRMWDEVKGTRRPDDRARREA